MGTKKLYTELDLTINPKERIGLVGRNGVGKSTLLGIMSGDDTDFTGLVEKRRGLVIVATAQEHRVPAEVTTLEYILGQLPEYAHLHHIITTYPETMGEDMDKIHAFTEALGRFDELGYYQIEEKVLRELEAFQITEALARGSFSTLSGGQKRLADLAKVTVANGDIALIDEPTNHMDYVAKETFIEWLQDTDMAVVVITHDRDVLAHVDRIVEIRDRDAISFNGDYEAYLKRNGETTMNAVEQYEYDQRTLVNLHKQVIEARRKKGMAGGPSATRFRIMEDRLQREYDELKSRLDKPSFWIDAEQLDTMQGKAVEKYDRYKAKNIRMNSGGAKDKSSRLLVSATKLSLGYSNPLFEDITFRLGVGDRLELKGRNGVGKSTIIKHILASAAGKKPSSQIYAGEIELDSKIVIGIYEQEIDEKYLKLPLGTAITRVHEDNNIPFNQQKLMQILSDYLFEPQLDGKLEIERLSGGQKARFQLIKMLSTNPNLLILDEPTNHLDLPSIEELEKMLSNYPGAVLYVSHDSYFTKNVGGEVVVVKAAEGIIAG
jgi:ATPase subunit of ABC transporter with duplicated ATPase domains